MHDATVGHLPSSPAAQQSFQEIGIAITNFHAVKNIILDNYKKPVSYK
jgi:hypothetical protein